MSINCRLLSMASVTLCCWLLATYLNDAFAIEHTPPIAADSVTENQITQGVVSYEVNGQLKQMLALDTQVNMKVSGLINRVTVKQEFTNTEDNWVNAKYVFPLPENAAVDDMRLRIGQRVIEGKISPKQQAKKQFEQAKKQGKQASLVSQQQTNIFTTELANIAPRQKVVVEMSYLQTISYKDGQFSLRFPLTVAPRYRPKTHQGPYHPSTQVESPILAESATAKLADNNSHHVQMDVEIDAGFEVTNVVSHYHPVTEVNDGRKSYVSVQGNVPLNRDFVLSWQTHSGDEVAASGFYQQGKTHQDKVSQRSHPLAINGDQSNLYDSKVESSYAMAMLMPPNQSIKSTHKVNRELVMVIDTSGSMMGDSIVQAKKALEVALNGLDVADKFNIIAFDSYVNQLFEYSVPASARNISHAKRFIQSLEADNGTEIAPALNAALSESVDVNRSTEWLRQVLFITDGSVSNEAQLFEQISFQLNDSRLFTVGIGSAPNSHFMRRAAEMGKGTYTYIGQVSDVVEKMTQLLDKISQPVLTDVQIEFADGTMVDYWPSAIKDVYQHTPVVISFKTDKPSMPAVVISGKIQGQYWQKTVDFSSRTSSQGLDLVWANAKITELELYQTPMNKQKTAAQVEKIALDYHLVSSQTSLIAVDVTPANINATALSENVARLMPAGWRMNSAFNKLPQTATASRLWLLSGGSLLIFCLLYWLWFKGVLPGQRQFNI
ncbi:marine proteobacterial sortase target protein [Shewanella gaetbuli]|uniref:Marine proteobacterial sortase target protein n=1 Tax=Shewanella gaetbuli TaxID=220752 RepID=A0A9X2CLS3_9GAMM|nr:marine proteobacterial sortase target protein [Shewanella gaetbuli]MCL1142999.1 marine proteobacterial sortase target protein [Shewanella gaetbuli]